eukprot:scaffold2446_cov106-Cylindrotheca_fusiformis.AAC.4
MATVGLSSLFIIHCSSFISKDLVLMTNGILPLSGSIEEEKPLEQPDWAGTGGYAGDTGNDISASVMSHKQIVTFSLSYRVFDTIELPAR